jgi:hypothetical protein
MDATIDLDNQLLFSRVEVNHIVRDPSLPPKFPAVQPPVAQRVP